jgi:hypothetical protein
MRTLAAAAVIALSLTLLACEQPPRHALEPRYIPPASDLEQGDCPPGRARERDDAPCQLTLDTPALPRFQDWACPEGWEPFNPRERYQIPRSETGPNVEDFLACRAPDHRPAAEVPLGYRNATHSSEPVLIGAPCPADGQRWPSPDELRDRAPGYDGPLVYIAPDADPDAADGTQAAPFPSLRAALERAAAPGALFALATGAYDEREPVTLAHPVAVVGACARQSAWRSDADALRITASGVQISDLSLESGAVPLRLESLAGTAPVLLRGLELRRARGAALEARDLDAPLLIDDLAVRHLDAERDPGALSRGLVLADTRAPVELKNLWITNTCINDIHITRAAQAVSIRDLVSQDTTPTARCDTPDEPPNHFAAVFARDGQRLDARGLVLEGATQHGLLLHSLQRLHLDDIHIKGTSRANAPPHPEERGDGTGIELNTLQQAALTQILIERPGSNGVYARRLNQLVVEDVVVAQTQPLQEATSSGEGVEVAFTERATIRRALLADNVTAGLGLRGDSLDQRNRSVEYTIEDIWAWRTSPTAGGPAVADRVYASGLQITQRPQVRGARVLLEDGEGSGLQASIRSGLDGPVWLFLTDLTIRGTRPARPSPLFEQVGAGLFCYFGCAGELRRVALYDNHFAGALLHGPLTDLTLRDALIQRSRAVQTDQGAPRGGVGALVTEGASLHAERFLILDQDLLGLLLLGVARADLQSGDIARTPIGLDALQIDVPLEESYKEDDVNWYAPLPMAIDVSVDLDALDHFFTALVALDALAGEP